MQFRFVVFFLLINILSKTSFCQNESHFTPHALPLITTFSPAQYQGGIQNWAITQDTSGYIYIANNYGLIRFDGASWKLYEVPGSTKSRSIAVQKTTNRIYIGGQRQLGYFEQTLSGLQYKDLINQVPDSIQLDEVWDLIPLNGHILANVNGHMMSIEDDEIIPIGGVKDVECIVKIDSLVLAGTPTGIYQLDWLSNTFKKAFAIEGHNFRGIVKHQGQLTFFTYDGVIFQSTHNGLSRQTPPIHSTLVDVKVNRVFELENENIAVGTQNNGLIILDKKLQPVLHLTKNKGLNHRTVLAIYEDNFGNLWVGLNNGICSIELNSPFSLINENIGLEGTGYDATSFNGSIYLGTSSGLFRMKSSDPSIGTNSGYEVVEGSEGLVNNLSVIENNVILGHHEGSFVYSTEGIRQFFDQTGTWDYKKTNDGRLLLGGSYEGFYLFEDASNPKVGKKLEGLNESSRIFEFANDTMLWMTHGYKGAYKIELRGDSIKSVRHYGVNDGFPSNLLISVYRIENQLIFTGETGIYSYDNSSDRFEPHPFLNEWFQNKHVSKIKESANGQIYFIANGEVGVLNKKSIGVYELEQKPFKKINGYLSDDLENISVISDEIIMLGAKEGFVLYQPLKEKQVLHSFKAFLSNVTLTTASDSTETISGEYFSEFKVKGPKVMRFNYAAPFFDGMENLTYSYRLSPYDDQWSEWSSTNWKEYTNLPSSDYVFEIKARNIYGEESLASSYSFEVSPLWYESDTAYGVYSAIILILFGSVLYTRERKHKTEKILLNQTMDEEIKQKEREISEFSAKTNEQIAALKNENLKKEIDHKNSQLASVTMHLLSKNEFVMSIRKKLSDALNTKNNQEDLTKIVKSIDRNIDKDEAWDTFVHHFDQVHGNFLHKLKDEVSLTPQETKLCAYLKMNMSTKDIANLMNITVRGVELSRYRLRKKLGIDREVNLVSYLDKF